MKIEKNIQHKDNRMYYSKNTVGQKEKGVVLFFD